MNKTLLNTTDYAVFGTKPADTTQCSTITVKTEEDDHLSFAVIRSLNGAINFVLVRTDHGATMNVGIELTGDTT